MSLADLWRLLESEGGISASRRVDASSRPDFYASIDGQGRRGLILLTPFQPPEPPMFDTVSIAIQQRFDGRWAMAIWLRESYLSPIFTELCESLVRGCEAVPLAQIPALVIHRLINWHRLLDFGASGELSINELRGLVAELIIFRECLSHWPADVVAEGWTGPLGSPQDFALPGALLEVKASPLSLSSVTISSVEQLDVLESDNLFLAVVPLATVSQNVPGSFSANELLSDILKMMREAPVAMEQMRGRVAATGYWAGSATERFFHNNSPRFFRVINAFPRIRRSDLSGGIVSAEYQIAIDACADFEVAPESIANGT